MIDFPQARRQKSFDVLDPNVLAAARQQQIQQTKISGWEVGEQNGTLAGAGGSSPQRIHRSLQPSTSHIEAMLPTDDALCCSQKPSRQQVFNVCTYILMPC